MAFKAGAILGEAILNTSKWDSGLGKITKGTAIAGAAIAGLFTKIMWDSIQSANEFQKSMSNVATIVDETQVSTQGLAKSLLKLDPALGSTTNLTEGLYQAFSAGAETAEEAIKTTADAAKFAKAALTDTNTAVDVLTTATNAYGKEVVNTEQASDIFFTTIQKGKITGEELAGSIGQSIPLFASSGIKLEELASGMAAMTKQGISANESTTQLNAIVNSFLKPSEELAQNIEEMGFASGAAFLESEGLAGALELVENATAGDAAEIAKLLPNIRAMRGAMALTGVGGKEFTDTLEDMENATGATDTAFNKQEKTFETLQNSLGKTQIIIGGIGKSFVDEIAAGATEANEAFNEFLMSQEAAETFGEVMGVIAGVFEVIKTAVQPIIDTIGPVLQEIFQALEEATNKLTGETASGAGAFKILAGASKLVSIGLTIMGKAAKLAVTFIANLIDIVLKSGAVLGGFFEALAGNISWDEFGRRVEEAGDSFNDLKTDIELDAKDLVNTTMEEFARFGDETNNLATDMQEKFTISMDITKQIVTNTWDAMITGQENAVEEAKDNNENLLDNLENTNDDIVNDTKTAAQKWAETWNDAIIKNIEQFSGFYDLFSEVTNFGLSNVTDLINGGMENQEAELENSYRKREEALRANLENALITQEEYDAQLAALENEKRKEQNELAKKNFENQKALKTASVIMNSADAIMGWWNSAASLGPIAGPIFGGAMTTLTLRFTARRIEQINSQEFVPQFQTGGTTSFPQGMGFARVNEQGGEILQLPDGTTVIPNDISRDIASASGGTQNINFVINNPVVQDERMLDKMVMKISRKLGTQLRLAT